MTDVVLTSNVTLNGGSVDVTIIESTGISQRTSLDDGWSSTVVEGFRGADTITSYHLDIALDHYDPTKSPVVDQLTLDVPTNVDVSVTVTETTTTSQDGNTFAQSFEDVVPTLTAFDSDVVSEYSESTEGATLTETNLVTPQSTKRLSEKTLDSTTASLSSKTNSDEFAQSTESSTLTSGSFGGRFTYPWVKIYRDIPNTGVSFTSSGGTIEYNEIAIYEQRIGANIDHVRRSWSNNAIPFGEGANIYKLSLAITGVLDGIDYRTNVAHTNIHVPYATGKALDRIGNLANVARKDGESDDRYRKRIIVSMRASVTGTTYDEVAEITAELLDTSVRDVTFEFRKQEFPATLFVLVDDGDMENTPFTAEEVADLLDRVVPADHDVVLDLQGTFLFKDIGATDEPEHGFTSVSPDYEEGGTLSGEIGQ